MRRAVVVFLTAAMTAAAPALAQDYPPNPEPVRPRCAVVPQGAVAGDTAYVVGDCWEPNQTINVVHVDPYYDQHDGYQVRVDGGGSLHAQITLDHHSEHLAFQGRPVGCLARLDPGQP